MRLGEMIIKGFCVCKRFKFLTLTIDSEWCSFPMSVQHSLCSQTPAARDLFCSLHLAWLHQGHHLSPCDTGKLDSSSPGSSASTHSFGIPLGCPCHPICPFTGCPYSHVCFAFIKTMSNQHGFTFLGLVNPPCLRAQTALWAQMWLVNCTSKEDKST